MSIVFLIPYEKGMMGLSGSSCITLQVFSSETSMFLAARSLWTKPLPARYFIPAAISLQNLNRVWGVLDGTISPGLQLPGGNNEYIIDH